MGKYETLMIALLLLGSEVTVSSQARLDNQDLEFMEYLVHAYYCTGDPNWWRLIGKTAEFKKHYSGLRFILHTAVAIWCPSYHLSEENRAYLIKDAKMMVSHDKAGFDMEALEEIGECFGKAIYKRLLSPYFCPHSEDGREGVSSIIEQARKLFCSKLAEDVTSRLNHFVCSFLDVIPTRRKAIEEILLKYGVCPRRLEKRQYDLVTFLKAFDGACSGFVNAIDLKIKYGEKRSKLYFFEFYCCFNVEYI